MDSSIKLLVFLSFAAVSLGDHHGHRFNQQYPFSLTLSDDNYYLYWNFSVADETINFAVRVKTTGWVGFGISPNGQMPGSDVVIGWVDGEKSYFHDRYAEQRSLPPIDDMQDWFLISAAINDGYTELEFSRNFTTCDNESKDLTIEADTSRVVYSWNDNTPTVTRNGDQETYSLVPHQFKASASVNLLGGSPNSPTIPANAMEFTVNVTDALIPAVETTYWCRGLSLESLVGNTDDPKYIIKIGPSISEGSEPYVHHVLAYTCNGLNETTDLGPGGNCHMQSSEVQDCRGSDGVLIAAWAVGGIEFTYPENVAYPIGGQNGHQYIVIEMHYNNPSSVPGVIDNSGITFTYINNRREHDAGILFLGHTVSTFLVVPPRQSNYTVSAHCPSQCTDKYIPSDGIKVFANMLHTHLVGTGLSLSVLRRLADGTTYEEVMPIERNLNYDFNFQQITHLLEEVTVLPGDEIRLNCYYNTTGRSGATVGGESTSEEMCLAFPIYYPRIEMDNCESQPAFNALTPFVLANVPPQNISSWTNLANDFSAQSISDAVSTVDWTDESGDSLQRAVYVTGSQYSFCFSGANDEYVDNTQVLPVISRYYSAPAPVRDCTVKDGAALVHVSAAIVLLMATICAYLLYL